MGELCRLGRRGHSRTRLAALIRSWSSRASSPYRIWKGMLPIPTLPEEQKDQARLAVRNLLRGYLLRMPTGQAVAQALNRTPLTASQIEAAAGSPEQVAALQAGGFSTRTPLWYYILAEAAHGGGQRSRAGGQHDCRGGADWPRATHEAVHSHRPELDRADLARCAARELRAGGPVAICRSSQRNTQRAPVHRCGRRYLVEDRPALLRGPTASGRASSTPTGIKLSNPNLIFPGQVLRIPQ